MSATRTSVHELESLLRSESLYACLDVRERGEFALEQIEGVTPLARGTLESRVETMIPNRALPIVVACDDGRRSALAAATLNAMGYARVSVLDGGLAAWKARGLPTIAGWGLRGKEYAERVAVNRGVPQMTAAELAERQRQGERLTVIDVRTDEEYLRGHVPEAYHIPGGQLLLEVPALPVSDEHTIVVSCAGRTRGILGAETLRTAGLEKVYALENGGMGWRLAGYELESGAGRGRPGAAGEMASWVEEATRGLAREQGIRPMSVPDFAALRASGDPCYAVDIRLPEEYRAGHVPGSISIPAGQFALQHENFLAVRSAPVIILSDDAIRPIWAAALCQDLGFPDVYVLNGGIGAWTSAGHGLESGDAPSRVFGLEEARRQVPSVDAPTLAELRTKDSRLLLLDVRGSGEFGTGHIPGARWLARGKLELGIAAMAPDHATPLVTVCDSGVRSALAAATLRGMGYPNARYLAAGIAAWRAAGRPIVDGLEGADVSRAEAQGDIGSTQWTGAMARTREDMLKYLADEEALGHRSERSPA
jgi:rhodanese-related sulfurtransferase